jgi:putative membrane protein
MSPEIITAVSTTLDQWGHHGWNDGGGGWMLRWGGLMMLAFVALVGAVVWLIATRTGPQATSPTDRAREVLAERYARGELTTEEYREWLDALR